MCSPRTVIGLYRCYLLSISLILVIIQLLWSGFELIFLFCWLNFTVDGLFIVTFCIWLICLHKPMFLWWFIQYGPEDNLILIIWINYTCELMLVLLQMFSAYPYLNQLYLCCVIYKCAYACTLRGQNLQFFPWFNLVDYCFASRILA